MVNGLGLIIQGNIVRWTPSTLSTSGGRQVAPPFSDKAVQAWLAATNVPQGQKWQFLLAALLDKEPDKYREAWRNCLNQVRTTEDSLAPHKRKANLARFKKNLTEEKTGNSFIELLRQIALNQDAAEFAAVEQQEKGIAALSVRLQNLRPDIAAYLKKSDEAKRANNYTRANQDLNAAASLLAEPASQAMATLSALAQVYGQMDL